MPHLFEPLTVKDVTARNRIAVSPMCQYSSVDGMPTDWHLVHLGARAVGGAGLVVAEATAVSPEGRISPGDAGIWSDAHVDPYRRIVRFLKENGAVAGIQLAHAGRKASVRRPWDGDDSLPPGEGAWQTVAPTAEPFGGGITHTPEALTPAAIGRVTGAFVAAAKRALAAGFDWLELHFAHGYLAHEFYSPLANKRADEYGGSFDNRTRFIRETFRAVRGVWPGRLPLTARLSVTDWTDGGVTVEESTELARRLKADGLDLLDVSQGFATPDVSNIPWGPGFMVPHAGRIKREAGIPTSTSWLITEPEQAEAAVRAGHLDQVMLGRASLGDPHWPYHAAKALGVETPQSVLPVQYAHWLKR